MTGFDVPFTDDGGHLLMDPHPSHQDWPWPMTYGGPVMTGWETPFTDLEGSLLRGAGQYGTFTMTNPYDHSNFSNVDLDSEKLIGDPFYRYTGSAADENLGLYLHGMTATGADADAGQQFGSALGTAFGAATGDDAKAWGQAGSSIASSIEQGSDSGDWGGAIASIASAAAKVAVPAIVKAASSGSKPSTTATPSAGTPTTPSVTPPAATAQHQAALARDPRRQAMQKLMVQMRKLAQQYGISIPPPRRAVAQPSGATLQQLQQFMQSVAPQQGAS